MSELRKRILIVSPCPTHPPDAGNRVRILTLAQDLIDLGHEVHFAFTPRSQFRQGDDQTMADFWGDRLHMLRPFMVWDWPTRIRRKTAEMVLMLWSKVGSGLEWGPIPEVDSGYLSSWTFELMALQRRHGFHAVMAEYIFSTLSFAAFGSEVLKIVDVHDIFSERNLAMDEADIAGPRWLSIQRESETRALDRADRVIAIQAEEAEQLSTLTSRPVVIVGHVWDVPGGVRRSTATHPQRILVVASGNAPNTDGCKWFAREVLPRIREQVPGAEFRVVGSVGNGLPREVAEAPGIDLAGVVEDLAAEYRDAAVVVNPVRFGTGLAVKTVEALGYGSALVSTQAGVRGLTLSGWTDALPYVTADGPQALAEAIVALITDRQTRDELGRRALEFMARWKAEHRARLETLFETH